MIRLNDEYCIKFDGLNIILCKKIESKKSDKENYKAIGYFSDFEHLSKKLILDHILINNFNTLEEIIQEIKNFEKEISDKLNKKEME